MSDTDKLVGKTIGSYRIVKCLGKGGMGAVYFGEHPKIESKVAIKVLLPRYVSAQDIVRRFFDEARAVNRIGHPGIVRIHDCNKQDDVGVYLVMELLEGESLAERFSRLGRLSWEEVARLVQQSASALHASHNMGIIHRDLKPANIFVVEDPDMPGGERIKILDFGIAKLLEDNDPIDGHGTKTGMVIGSPMYMSPEQCIDSKSVDRRTDIYSLGAIAYRLIAGEFPYEADTLGRLILKQQKERPAPLDSLGVQVPASVTEVIHRALETDREERYPDMARFKEAMRAAVEAAGDEPVRGDRPRAPEEQPTGQGVDPGEARDMTGPRSRDIGLDETAVADSEVTPPPDGTRETNGEDRQTTLSGTTGESARPTTAEPRRGSGAIIAGGIVLLIGVIIALVMWSRQGQHLPNKPNDPGRRTAALGGSRQAPGARVAVARLERGDEPVEVRPAPSEAGDRSEDDDRPATKIAAPPAKRPPPPLVAKPAPDPVPAARVQITLKLTPAGARVSLDGEPVSANPLVLPADGKLHKLKVEAPGFRAEEHSVKADDNQTLKINLEREIRKGKVRSPGRSTKKKLLKKKKKKKKRIYFRNL